MKADRLYISEKVQVRLNEEYQIVLKRAVGYSGDTLSEYLHYRGSRKNPDNVIGCGVVDLSIVTLNSRLMQLRNRMTQQEYPGLRLIKDLMLLYDAMGIDEPEKLEIDYNHLRESGKLERIIEAGTWLSDRLMSLAEKHETKYYVPLSRIGSF